MSKPQTELTDRLAGMVGSANVTANPALRLDGLVPALRVAPASTAEVADCLRLCSEMNLAVVPAGRGTWLECGNPLRRADVVLSLERMNRIIDYSPPDLTITVEAGMRLRGFNETIRGDRLWLPLDPPGASIASIGAIIACNSSGALRCGYGTPRDYLIGLSLAHADGSQSKSGGRVVKNVAGYDLNKLYVGSYGTLAVITEATFKLRPLPEHHVTIALTAKKTQPLTAIARQVQAAELQPAAFVLTSMAFEELFGPNQGAETLLLRFADNEATVTYQVEWLGRACADEYAWTEVSGDDEAALWNKVCDFDNQWQCAVRFSVPLSATTAAYEYLLSEGDCRVTADLGSGIVRAAGNGKDDLTIGLIHRYRAAAEKLGGTLFIEKAALIVRQQTCAWSAVGAHGRLMRAIKEKFDPQGILNPGRFVAGI
jgi:glycolate oxidase FAD binding subunit